MEVKGCEQSCILKTSPAKLGRKDFSDQRTQKQRKSRIGRWVNHLFDHEQLCKKIIMVVPFVLRNSATVALDCLLPLSALKMPELS